MRRVRKRPHGISARRARARGVPFPGGCRKKRPSARARQISDEGWPWSRMDLIRMDRAFCAALRREIARGTERARGPAAKAAARRAIGRLRRTPPRAGAPSPAGAGGDVGSNEQSR